MNYTKKASRNQENAVFIESELMAKFYFNDFVNSFLQSAPLRLTGGGSGGNVNDDKPFGYTKSLNQIPAQFRPYIKKGKRPVGATKTPKKFPLKRKSVGSPRKRAAIKKWCFENK